MRIKKEYKKPIENGRFLILSRFSENNNRISSGRAEKRNNFVATLADEVLVPYAAPGSKTEKLCEDLIRKGKKIKTFESKYNKRLIELSVEAI